MKVPIVLLFLFVTKINLAFSQEIMVEVSILERLTPKHHINETLIQRSNDMVLPYGQWTDIDRENYLHRFEKAMNYIVLNNRTDLLSSLSQISDYYNYLNNQPVVINSRIKWQAAAIDVTSMLKAVKLAIGARLLGDAVILLNEHDPEREKVAEIIAQGISPSGLQFIDGTASKQIVADITRNFYNPLIKSNKVIEDPFLFDANAVYREQFITLQQPFYDKFNDFDKRFIVGDIAKWYASVNWANLLDFSWRDINLVNPKDRLYIGLRIMGYSNEKINAYIKKIK